MDERDLIKERVKQWQQFIVDRQKLNNNLMASQIVEMLGNDLDKLVHGLAPCIKARVEAQILVAMADKLEKLNAILDVFTEGFYGIIVGNLPKV